MLGPRALDGNGVGLTLAHAGTSLALSYDKPDPLTLRGHWEAQHLAEWGLRFWIVLVLRWTPPGTDQAVEWSYDSDERRARGDVGHRTPWPSAASGLPLLATFHDSFDALQREYETKGYFCLEFARRARPRRRAALPSRGDAALQLRGHDRR